MLPRPWISRFQHWLAFLLHGTITDRQIAGYLADLFEQDLPDTHVESLRFYVKQRIVTLYGTLYQAADHDNVMRLTARIPGIEAIVDRVQVVEDVHREELGARVVLLLNDTFAPNRLLPA